jgi:hypothetical protein
LTPAPAAMHEDKPKPTACKAPGKKITASRYGGAQRDTDTLAPDGTNLTMKESPSTPTSA